MLSDMVQWIRDLVVWMRWTRRNRYRQVRAHQNSAIALARPFSQPAAKGFSGHQSDRQAHVAHLKRIK